MNGTYDLELIKSLIQQGQYQITNRAINDARKDFGFDRSAIINTVLWLRSSDLDQTIPSYIKPGLWQDVYKRSILIEGNSVVAYIKLQILENSQTERVVIISFHKT